MKINVNDGFVELVDHMGDDLAIVNAARVSYAGSSDKWTDSSRANALESSNR